MGSTASSLRAQWTNPGDILSLLLLVGGDIVQKAVAQLVGYRVRLPGSSYSLSITPIAFSFGWAAYAFSNLLSAVGDMRLMPLSDSPSILVNSSNGFTREVRSWALGRLLRDHEARHAIDPRPIEDGGRAESIRVDIFHLGPVTSPEPDFVWWLGWATLVLQFIIAVIPWAVYGNWAVMLLTLCGTLLAALTCAMPQWVEEKWAGSKLQREKITCLTRGNGHFHVMVFIGDAGSWNLEQLSTSVFRSRPETRWVSLVLAVAWTALLISVSGLEEQTWFLVAIGSIGMLQNILAAGITRDPSASNFHISKSERAPTIIGRRQQLKDDPSSHVDLDEDMEALADVAAWVAHHVKHGDLEHGQSASVDKPIMPSWVSSMSKKDGVPEWLEPLPPSTHNSLPVPRKATTDSFSKGKKESEIIYAIGVHGALIELEKWVPTAGLAMVPIFFPSGLVFEEKSVRDNVHKKFWKRAFHTVTIRRKAEAKRRAEQRRVPTN
ncbi:hypothetical protein HJFPF1_08629 [Paramyrothecium foliicola]|nr:hypothetical protein HJFPF1_08629 [Paramyrothecium foliicola]